MYLAEFICEGTKSDAKWVCFKKQNSSSIIKHANVTYIELAMASPSFSMF